MLPRGGTIVLTRLFDDCGASAERRQILKPRRRASHSSGAQASQSAVANPGTSTTAIALIDAPSERRFAVAGASAAARVCDACQLQKAPTQAGRRIVFGSEALSAGLAQHPMRRPAPEQAHVCLLHTCLPRPCSGVRIPHLYIAISHRTFSVAHGPRANGVALRHTL